nr:exfoliative toxin [Streptococcus agalactiae]
MEKEAKQIIDLKRNLFKIDVRAQKDEEKVFMRTACVAIITDYHF